MCTTSIQKNLQSWIDIGASSEVINWIENGVTWKFKTEQKSFVYKNYKFSQAQVTFIDSEIKDLLKRAAISEVSYVPKCRSVSVQSDVYPRKGISGEWLSIWDN